MNIKSLASWALRRAGLMQAFDRLRYALIRLKNRKRNRRFLFENPGIAMPPDYMMYESFQLDYERYYLNGRKTAEWLASLVSKYMDLAGSRILDWGCGPARVIRHLPDLFPSSRCFGTDYNPKTIAWCSAAFEGITFSNNGLMPGLIYEPGYFDLAYGISIFTHLSEEGHHAWLGELNRILKPGGILLLTLHGNSFRGKLNPREQFRFDEGHLIVRGRVREGHRTFTAFHPPDWVNLWITGFTLLEFIPGKGNEQDVYILRKKIS